MKNNYNTTNYNTSEEDFDWDAIIDEELGKEEEGLHNWIQDYKQETGYLYPEMWEELKYQVQNYLGEPDFFYDPETRKEYDFFASLIPFIRDAENAVLDRHGLKRIWPEEN